MARNDDARSALENRRGMAMALSRTSRAGVMHPGSRCPTWTRRSLTARINLPISLSTVAWEVHSQATTRFRTLTCKIKPHSPGPILAHSGCRDLNRRFNEIQFSRAAAARRRPRGRRASPGARSVSQHPHEPYSVMTQSMALIPQRSLERILPTEGPRYGIAVFCPASALALPRFRRSGSSLPRVSPGLGARTFEREKAHRTVVRQGRCQI